MQACQYYAFTLTLLTDVFAADLPSILRMLNFWTAIQNDSTYTVQ